MRILACMYTCAVAGASGYAGGELLRLLHDHPDFELTVMSAGGKAGHRVTTVHPHLPFLGSSFFSETSVELLDTADVVFLALPHGESGPIAASLSPDTVVVDLGADHRLSDAAAWRAFYGTDFAGTWLYGLPELPGRREQINGATRIANPGCYPTTIELGLAPLLAAGLVEADDVVIVAASGTSGAGRKPSENLLATAVMGSMSPYKVGGVHQHTPEIEQTLAEAAGQPVTVSFTPTLAPMPRGILATSTAKLKKSVTAADLRDALQSAYAGEPFVFVLPEGDWPHTGSTFGSNAVHIQVAADLHSGRAVVVSALDNLVKGASGQAIQNANIALGLNETLGLSSLGVAP